MEFWIGLSVGMHLGKILAGYLEKFGMAYGLLTEETSRDIDDVERATRGNRRIYRRSGGRLTRLGIPLFAGLRHDRKGMSSRSHGRTVCRLSPPARGRTGMAVM